MAASKWFEVNLDPVRSELEQEILDTWTVQQITGDKVVIVTNGSVISGAVVGGVVTVKKGTERRGVVISVVEKSITFLSNYSFTTDEGGFSAITFKYRGL